MKIFYYNKLEVSMRLVVALILVSVSLNFISCAREYMVHDEKHGKKKAAAHYIKMLEAPDRALRQMPDEVVKALNLKAGMRIADIGAGSGYFTRRFARAVAPSGVAIGYDVDPGMIAYMKEDAAKSKRASYRAVLIDPKSPKLEKSYYDMIFMCNTYHHMESRVAYLILLKPSLKKGGRFVIVDYKKDSEAGPPADCKLEMKQVADEFLEAGYKLLISHDFLPDQYFLEFVP